MSSASLSDFVKAKRILFLCYGNICRSPFCERLFRQARPDLEVDSAGFIRTPNRTTPPEYQTMARRHQVELSDHRSKWVSPELVAWADLIVLMDLHNRADMEDNYRASRSKCLMLGQFLKPTQEEIADPYMIADQEAIEVYQQMSEAVLALSSALNQG